MIKLPGEESVDLHVVESGPKTGPAVVFAHALGTDLTLWDRLLPHLPAGLRLIRMDMRGHGQSPCPDGPYPMGDLVQDAARVLDRLQVKDGVFVGLSIGGVIAQGLAAERPDLLRGLVLSNTAAKIATPDFWTARMDAVRRDGIDSIVEANIERWFARATAREQPALLDTIRTRLASTPLEGYLGCVAALAETDLIASTARLRLPTLVIAGTEDGSTPADLVRETADLIYGARFELLRKTGHLPPLERPEDYARILTEFLESIKHV